MLRQRLLTALVLIPLVVWGTLALSNGMFAVILAAIIALGVMEWSRFVGYGSALARGAYLVLLVGLMAGLFGYLDDPGAPLVLGGVALVWWLFALVSVLRYPSSSAMWQSSALARAAAGAFVLIPAWGSLAVLQRNPEYVLLLLVLIWAADSGAYFAGRRFGRRKLAPKVSPGKTWEGVGGALALTVLVALGGVYWLKPAMGTGTFVALCLLTVGFSVLGDLLESMFKRMMNIKDSGGLLPGHGGVLDRIDSLTAAAPIFLLGLYWLERSQ